MGKLRQPEAIIRTNKEIVQIKDMLHENGVDVSFVNIKENEV